MNKFKTVEELEKAYSQLEKSFTQKCQQLAQLQRGTSQEPPQNNSGPDNDFDVCVVDKMLENPQIVESILQKLFKMDLANTPKEELTSQEVVPPSICGNGGSISVLPPLKPKTLQEAGELAKKIIN